MARYEPRYGKMNMLEVATEILISYCIQKNNLQGGLDLGYYVFILKKHFKHHTFNQHIFSINVTALYK